jgi:branched-subunit amino acid transport protein
MNIWLTILCAGLLTYGIRLSFIALVGERPIPLIVRRSLRFVPPAVLTAIIFPELFIYQGGFDLSLSNPRLWAGLLAAVVAWRTRNAVLTILVGMLTLWILVWIMAR